MITAERLRQLLVYDEYTGLFRWLAPTSIRVKVGDVAGSSHIAGYVEIGVDGRSYLAHRLAWLYVVGEWPRRSIDHINGDRTDNRWANLRDVSPSLNHHNRHKKTPSRTGLAGVSPKGARFMAKITINYQQMYLGLFDSAEQAHAAYMVAKAHYLPVPQ